MDLYLQNYTTFKKHIIFEFNIHSGGLGDFLKFFTYLLQKCIENNIRFSYLKGTNSTDEYVKLQHDILYITPEQLINKPLENIQSFSNIYTLESTKYYTVNPFHMYDILNLIDSIYLKLSDIFFFDAKVIEIADTILNGICEYESIHLRLGDFFMTDFNNIHANSPDKRPYNESSVIQFILEHTDTPLYFFCDNYIFKKKMRSKYDNLRITELQVGHTGYEVTSKEHVLNAVVEFYILSKSKKIYIVTKSGFSIMASKFNNIPIQAIQ